MKNVAKRGKKARAEVVVMSEKEAKVRNGNEVEIEKGKRAKAVKGSEVEAKKGDGADQEVEIEDSEAATGVLTDDAPEAKVHSEKTRALSGNLLII